MLSPVGTDDFAHPDHRFPGPALWIFATYPRLVALVLAMSAALWAIAPTAASTPLATFLGVSFLAWSWFGPPRRDAANHSLDLIQLAFGVLPIVLWNLGLSVALAVAVGAVAQASFVAYRLRTER